MNDSLRVSSFYYDFMYFFYSNLEKMQFLTAEIELSFVKF
jgi:hypothetical protein